ncbi:MAG: TonB family protein [Gammaproteobacteria bacterium]
MTYVQRLPHLHLPDVSISGRSLTLLLVIGLHVILVGLIVQQLRITTFTPPPELPPVTLLPETMTPAKPVIAPNTAEPVPVHLDVVPLIPDLEIERAPNGQVRAVDPQPSDWASDGSSTLPPSPVRIEPRQDPAYPIGRPAYPPLSIRLEEAGVVVVNLCVDSSGRPADVHVRTTSGYPRLDQAAVAHLRKRSIRLMPGTENGMPVAMCTDMRVRFGFDSR